jgi:hypothetical protein
VAPNNDAARAVVAGAPRAVRLAFLYYLGNVVLAVTAAVVNLVMHLSGPMVLIGPAIEAIVFLGIGSQMVLGKLWARVAVMSFTWMFVAIKALEIYGLNKAFGHNMDQVALFTFSCVGGELVLLILGMVSMYRSSTHDYFS